MTKSIEIPDCIYQNEASLITPSLQTPNHLLYLSNLDIRVINFPVDYLFLFKKSTCVDSLKLMLSRILVDYYPFAGRLRSSKDGQLEIDCNGKGALFAEGLLDLSVREFLEGSTHPNESWKNLFYRVEASSLFDIPPLIIQVIHLKCGGMILLTKICHCLCDAQGMSQFLNAWAEIIRNPNSNLSVIPFHSRLLLKSPLPERYHPEFNSPPSDDHLPQSFISQPFVPISITFTPSQILYLKKLCMPSLKCTSFEVLASHVWRTWAKSLDLHASSNVKLIVLANVRKKLNPNLPNGFYGNAFVSDYAESVVDNLITSNLSYSVELVQAMKEKVNNYARSIVDSSGVGIGETDLSACLLVNCHCKLGLEDIDFGNGKPVHLGPPEPKVCYFLPVVGDFYAFRVFMSVPLQAAEKFEFLLKA